MEDDRIIALLERALDKLLRVDSWLLTHDLNEPCITHQIAQHLTQRFLMKPLRFVVGCSSMSEETVLFTV